MALLNKVEHLDLANQFRAPILLAIFIIPLFLGWWFAVAPTYENYQIELLRKNKFQQQLASQKAELEKGSAQRKKLLQVMTDLYQLLPTDWSAATNHQLIRQLDLLTVRFDVAIRHFTKVEGNSIKIMLVGTYFNIGALLSELHRQSVPITFDSVEWVLVSQPAALFTATLTLKPFTLLLPNVSPDRQQSSIVHFTPSTAILRMKSQLAQFVPSGSPPTFTYSPLRERNECVREEIKRQKELNSRFKGIIYSPTLSALLIDEHGQVEEIAIGEVYRELGLVVSKLKNGAIYAYLSARECKWIMQEGESVE
ncbi:hypothetical protein [Vibrio sonorensis]|uniref:hypothetical protein n=1 Tax=Vibrio sonorensis TaxID=1004316 RepID=UPI0011145EBB|nr:hypothetical protein [Vibrio sonorensis]